jgi:hypothetical protein
VLAGALLLLLGGTSIAWSALRSAPWPVGRDVASAFAWGGDVQPVTDEDVARLLEQRREQLHDEVVQVRTFHPDSVGERAVDDLHWGASGEFVLHQMRPDATVVDAVLVVGEQGESSGPFGPRPRESWHSRLCLRFTLETATDDDRGTVTSEQAPCPAPEPTPSHPAPGPERPVTVHLDRMRTNVPVRAPARREVSPHAWTAA